MLTSNCNGHASTYPTTNNLPITDPNEQFPPLCDNPSPDLSSETSSKPDLDDVINDVSRTTPDAMGNVEITWEAFEKLRGDLERAQRELTSRDDQCAQLTRVRDEVDQEIEELTASLFEEAHKMVHEANVGRANAEKKLYETELTKDGLQAEVSALKALVDTGRGGGGGSSPARRRPSSAGGSGQTMCSNCDTFVYSTNEFNEWTVVDANSKKEVDPMTFQFFVSWIESGCPLKENEFLSLILKDDITPCLRFPNDDMAKSVYKAVQNNTLAIEPIQSKPKKCSLTNVLGNCPYRIRMGNAADQWYPVSASCRSRIVSVIDFLTFLRYIRQGILKKDINVLYWQMMKHRAEISLARLGMDRKTTKK